MSTMSATWLSPTNIILFKKCPPPPYRKILKKALIKSRTKLYMCTVQAKKSGKLILLCRPPPPPPPPPNKIRPVCSCTYLYVAIAVIIWNVQNLLVILKCVDSYSNTVTLDATHIKINIAHHICTGQDQSINQLRFLTFYIDTFWWWVL